MPGVPIEMPSETVMVLNSTLLPPAPSTPAHASRASSPICMLQGVTLPQVDATPICGLAKSASPKPTARSMAREGACFAPSTTTRERALHAIETERPEGRHHDGQQQRVFTGAPPPALEAHVCQHAKWRRHAPP